MKDKIIVYCGGGAMSGVFGAGVLKGLYDRGLLEKVESIYGGSAGVLNASYLLSGQVGLGSKIYWEDLQKDFIYPRNIIWGTLDLFVNRFFKKIDSKDIHNVVNINHLVNIMSFVKPLDINKLATSSINLFVKVLDINSGDLKYINFKDYPSMDLLKASVAIKPHFFEEVLINENVYIDGTIKESIGLDYLLKTYPNHKLVLIINEPIRRGIRHYFKNIIEAIVSSLYPYRISLFKIFLEKEKLIRNDIGKALLNDKVLLIHPDFPKRALPRTVDSHILRNTFDVGYKEVDKILDFINKDN